MTTPRELTWLEKAVLDIAAASDIAGADLKARFACGAVCDPMPLIAAVFNEIDWDVLSANVEVTP